MERLLFSARFYLIFSSPLRPHHDSRYLGWNINYTKDPSLSPAKYFMIDLGENRGFVAVAGFLYNFKTNFTGVTVRKVEDCLNDTEWDEIFSNTSVQLIVMLCHIPTVFHELTTLFTHLNTHAPTIPMVFLTGHSHFMRTRTLDNISFALESGCFGHVLGLLQFELDLSLFTDAANQNSAMSSSAMHLASFDQLDQNSVANQIRLLNEEGFLVSNGADLGFTHKWLDYNRTDFIRVLNMTDPSTFDTPEGTAIRDSIAEKMEELHLNDVLGCAPTTYYSMANTSLGQPSLYRMFVDDALPHHGQYRVPSDGRRNLKQLFVMYYGGYKSFSFLCPSHFHSLPRSSSLSSPFFLFSGSLRRPCDAE
jgi:hypothetical protein